MITLVLISLQSARRASANTDGSRQGGDPDREAAGLPGQRKCAVDHLIHPSLGRGKIFSDGRVRSACQDEYDLMSHAARRLEQMPFRIFSRLRDDLVEVLLIYRYTMRTIQRPGIRFPLRPTAAPRLYVKSRGDDAPIRTLRSTWLRRAVAKTSAVPISSVAYANDTSSPGRCFD
jgi:hypothetical protein